MTISASLPVSGLINVQASLAAAAVQGQSTQNMLVLGNSAVIDPVTRMRNYGSATAIATDFGANAPETLFANEWFGQTPTPPSLNVGRWAQSATSGQLYGAPLTAAQQLLSVFTAITNGGFHIVIDGGSAESLTALNFSGAANLNAVAALIQAALTGATIVWNSVYGQFIVTSNSTGATSTVGFATAPTGGSTDISGILGLSAASSGAYQAAGIAAESAAAAVALFDTRFGGQWYGLDVLGAVDADIEAVAPVVAASSNKHFYWPATQEAGVLVPTSTTDIAYILKTANVSKVAVQYSGSSLYASAALAAIMMGVDYTGSNTVKAAMWQQLAGVAGDAINTTQLGALIAKNANGFVAYNTVPPTSIVQPGICSNGQWIDAVIGADALSLGIQTGVFNLFLTQHVAQSDPGNHLIKIAIQKYLDQFVTNGFIVPGVWNGPLFGALQNNADGTPPTLSSGYYIYQPLIASQASGPRNARISVPFQIAVNLAGAVQTVNVLITLAN